MMYLHKILPALFLPVGIALALLAAAAVTKKRAPLYMALLLLIFSSNPLASNLLFRMVESFESRPLTASLSPADAIVVLSGMLMSSPSADGGTVTEWDDPDRFFAGVELFKAGKAPLLVFTGGKLPWLPADPPEGNVLAPLAVQFGVPSDRVAVTPTVENTEDEAREVSRYLGVGKRIILVTSAFHMPRARHVFTAYGLDVVPFPVDFHSGATRSLTILDIVPTASSLWKSEIALRELLGRAYYRVKLAFSRSA